MSDVIIRAENLGKKYLLGRGTQSASRYRTLRDTLTDGTRNLIRRNAAPPEEEFWALREVSFEISRGEVVGIIGRNGAGKSTLLKILSRITEPTTGKVRIGGRVASLLEVGTGFHPELTGRENIYLNGAILGMHRVEIKAKFAEIVAFAEIERFLDTPVKRYSSGMYVRLAFSVAAHLDPEILIVDEVLAVGDAEFQKKCLGKMEQVAKGSGRTVLFVSHNMGAIAELCSSALLISAGRSQAYNSAATAIDCYLSSGNLHSAPQALAQTSRHIRAVGIIGSDGIVGARASLAFGDALRVRIELVNLPLDAPVGVNISFRNSSGHLVFLFSTNPHDGVELPSLSRSAVTFTMDRCYLAPGEYTLDLTVTEPAIRVLEEAHHLVLFSIRPKSIGGRWAYEQLYGDFFPEHRWEVDSLGEFNSPAISLGSVTHERG